MAKESRDTMKIYVLYHASCFDGFCAAWIAHKYFGDNAEYIPVQYGEDPPPMEMGSRVYILDFSYKKPVLENLLQTHDVIVLDHHKTAQEDLNQFALNPCIVFDMNKSGARLTWEWFYHETYPAPWLVDYTEDRDLWRWELKDSEIINLGLRTFPMNFSVWDSLEKKHCLRAGETMKRYFDELLKGMKEHFYPITIRGYEFQITNCTMRDLISEAAAMWTLGATFFIKEDGSTVVSLRSKCDVDVSAIAKSFGGGGHRGAAGFTLPPGIPIHKGCTL